MLGGKKKCSKRWVKSDSELDSLDGIFLQLGEEYFRGVLDEGDGELEGARHVRHDLVVADGVAADADEKQGLNLAGFSNGCARSPPFPADSSQSSLANQGPLMS